MLTGDCNVCINRTLQPDSAACVECGLSRKNYKPVTNAGRRWTLGYDVRREESKQSWISVTERLPNVNERVIVFIRGAGIFGNSYVLDAIRWNGEEWEFEEEAARDIWFSLKAPVTHWMPLPEPPKEET